MFGINAVFSWAYKLIWHIVLYQHIICAVGNLQALVIVFY